MLPSGIAFDRVVAEHLARLADEDRRHFPTLLHCVESWSATHGAALIEIAQQNHPSIVEALEETITECTDSSILEALFQALPPRTVLLREFSINLTRRLADRIRSEAESPRFIVLRSQLGGRLRDSGKPAEAFEVLKDVVVSRVFGSLTLEVQAHLLSNFATCLADMGQNQESFHYHTRVVEMLDIAVMGGSLAATQQLPNELANAAAASLRARDFEKAELFIKRAEAMLCAKPDRALSFRVTTIEFTAYAERHNFARAFELGRRLLPLLEDFEEAANDVYRTLLIDALVNVGSVALDEFLNVEASAYFERAASLALSVQQISDTAQARLKVLTTKLAVLTAKLQQGEQDLTKDVRLLLSQSKLWLEQSNNAYAGEIHRRILEVLVRVTTEEEQEIPTVGEIEELVSGEEQAVTDDPEDVWALARIRHTAALACSKLEVYDRALRLARQAVTLATSVSEAESVHDTAQRAVLVDSLSRRLEDNGEHLAALDHAESALELIEPCWEQSEKYRSWAERMFLRFHELAERSPELHRLERFLSKRAVSKSSDPSNV